LNFLRDAGSFELSLDMTEGQTNELAVELQFYGLLDRMMPDYAQELRRNYSGRVAPSGSHTAPRQLSIR
jgi:hypothetical protein